MHIIVNPASRGGGGERLAGLIASALDEMGVPYTMSRTSKTVTAAELAREAADKAEDLVICIGGDGTISEVAGGLANSGTALGIIPAGTGDDFAKFLGIPKDPLSALDAALSGETASFDLGAANDRIFINVAGSGLDVEVLRRTLVYKKIFRGLLAYTLGVLRAIIGYPAMSVTIETGGEVIERKVLLISVANGRYFGGGMCVAPNADASDGLFDVHWVEELPRWKIPLLLAGFIKGSYIKWPVAHHFRCAELVVTTSDHSLQLDGEIFAQQTVRYRILPQALKIKVPASSAVLRSREALSPPSSQGSRR